MSNEKSSDILQDFGAAAEAGDDSTNDLIVSQVVRSNELQSWFIGEHLAAQTQSTK